MDNNIAVNIKRIRSAQNINMSKLSELSGVSRSTCQQIESGKQREPRVRTLRRIAAGLGVPLQQLFAPAVELRRVRFRSTEKLRSRSQILADVGRWLTNYNELEEILEDSIEYRLAGVAEKIPTGTKRPIEAAYAVRKALGLSKNEPIHDICGLIDSSGIKLFPMSIATNAFFGLAVAPSEGGPAIAVNTWERISVERWIFSAAHELGHLVLHLGDFDLEVTDEDEVHELEANAFAAELLMPDEIFKREWEDARGLGVLERVIKIKRIFRVSYLSVLRRLEDRDEGSSNVRAHFLKEYKRVHGRSPNRVEEPEALSKNVFQKGAPEPMSASEPEHLFHSDFREDRLPKLVRQGFEDGKISMGRAAEILGLPLLKMREHANSWVV